MYYFFFFLVFLLTIFRLSFPKESSYSLTNSSFTGVVERIQKREHGVTLQLKNTERVLAFSNQNLKNISLGDTIKVKGKFLLPTKNTIPGLFSYREYLKHQNIFYQISVNSWKKIKKNRALRFWIRNQLYSYFEEDPYLCTLLLGDKTYLSSSVKKSYQENGISHLFAISGMHITLLASILTKLFQKLLFREETIFWIISFFFLLYFYILGFSPSLFRGILFYFFFSWNRIYYFYIPKSYLFFLVLSISLLWNPNVIYDIGFWYSYTISGFLLLTSSLLKGNYFISLWKVSILSFLSSLPITLYSFSTINLCSLFYNVLFVPMVSIIIFPLSLITSLWIPLLPFFQFLCQIMEKVSLFFSTLSFGKISFYQFPIWVYGFYFLLFFLFLWKRKKVFIFLYFLLLFFHLLYPKLFFTSSVMALDVGQGDSILIRFSHKNILIDTGGTFLNQSLVEERHIPFFHKQGIFKIHYLILSHGDFDHMGEAINLIENFKVEKVIFNCGPYNDLENELIKILDNKNIPYYSCIKELNIDNNKLYFLQTKEYDNENDNSNVIYTELNGYKFMFMGDASSTTEKEILNKYNLPNIDVLKVGHHGSRTSSSVEFIDEINPNYSIISVGKNNRYGHPNKEVLDNLNNSKIYRTDKQGSIMFKVKNNKLKIETCSP